MKKLLLLEDNAERIKQFREVLADLGADWELVHWYDAPAMLRDCENHFEQTRLISLDHDLNPQPGVTSDPGTGRQITTLLAGHLPVSPVIIHSTNSDAAWSMHNDLRFAGWRVERVGPIGEAWVRKLWLPKARELVECDPLKNLFSRSSDHEAALSRAVLSLQGLALGDAIGEMLAHRHRDATRLISTGLPAGPWFHTDDTEMAISIVEVLKLYGYIHQDALSRRFAWRFERDPDRGYGKMTRMQMNEIIRGGDWRKAAAGAFGGTGSMGNGGAMRVAPLGAFFADNIGRVVREAERSARVTHAHPEGVAGTVAVAIAAAQAAHPHFKQTPTGPKELFDAVLTYTPESQVRRRILIAAETPPFQDVHEAARLLGNGSLVTAPDTVPYALWCAAHHLDDFVGAIAKTISGGGDCDTNAAIVGGIVALSCGLEKIPLEWLLAREPLPF